MFNISPSKILPRIIFPLFLITLAIVPFVIGAELRQIISSAEELRELILALGNWGVVAFIAIQILQVVVFIIPGEVVQISGGYLFGVFLGTLYSLVGIMIGTMLNYLIGYGLGAPFVRSVIKEAQFRTISRLFRRRATFVTIFILFLIPGFPKDILIYLGGALHIRYRSFVIISILGRIPALIGSSVIGAYLFNEGWPVSIVILVVSLILLLFGVCYRKKILTWLSRKRSAKRNIRQ